VGKDLGSIAQHISQIIVVSDQTVAAQAVVWSLMIFMTQLEASVVSVSSIELKCKSLTQLTDRGTWTKCDVKCSKYYVY